MTNESAIVKQSYELIRTDLGLEEEWSFKDTESTFDRLEALLTRYIHHLLDHDVNRLLNALYRIDLPEATVKQILTQHENMASDLAKAVIKREKQKVLTRLKYQSS